MLQRSRRRSPARRRCEDLLFAFPLVLVAFSGLDASSGLSGQVAIGRSGLRRLIAVRMLAAIVPYVGIAIVASVALPNDPDRTWIEAPMLGVVGRVHAGVAARAAALPGRRLGGRDPRRRLQRGDARRVAAGLLARAQPPDPVADRLPAPADLDAGRDHRHRRAARHAAAADRRPRVPARHLGVRRDGRVHDRVPVGLPAALARARPRPPVPDPVQRPRGRGRPAAARGARRGALRGPRSCPCSRSTAARAGSGLGWMAFGVLALRLLPHVRGQAAAEADQRAREGADPQARRGRVRLDPRPGPRDAARRRHRPDRRPAGRRRERRARARAAP